MNTCPSEEQLQQLLDGLLQSTDESPVHLHVDTCAECQQYLEAMTSADDLVTGSSPSDKTFVSPSELTALLGKLRDQLPTPTKVEVAIRDTPLVTRQMDPGAPLDISDYQLQQPIGSGGMGTVYQAIQKSIKKSVAVKVLHPVDDDSIIERFLQEACAAAKLHHPNIVPVHGLGRTEDGGYFLVMDLIVGESLDRYVRHVEIPSSEVASIVVAIANAVQHAHDNGVIHRDLKPGNIVVDEQGNPLVTDFGIAKILGAAKTNISRANQALGTPSYMAPEQADPRLGAVGPATDVYGLGGLLYFLLTGSDPFSCADAGEIEIIAKVISDQLPPEPRSVNEKVPAFLNEICMRCLQKSTADRFPRAADVATAIEQQTLAIALPNANPADSIRESAKGESKLPETQVAQRIAIVHQPNNESDAQLARQLSDHFGTAGFEVTMDSGTGVGLQWAQQIEQRIRVSEVVVVLRSADVANDELVTHQVQIARQVEATEANSPRIIVVNVDHDEAAVGDWIAIVENATLVVFKTTESVIDLADEIKQLLRQQPKPLPQPNPVWRLEPPFGAIPLDSSFYLQREADSEFETALARRDSIVLVRGARQMGKTSLLARGLRRVRQQGMHVVLTDLQKLNSTDLQSPETLFIALGQWICDKLDLDTDPLDVWNERRGASVNFERYLRREVLGKLDAPLVWGLDEVDRLFPCPFSSEVFGLFRSWHNERALDPDGPWSQMTMAITYATEAHLFITDVNQSPFNVGTRITLQDFSAEQVIELNGRYQNILSEEDVVQLHALVAGHPYLTNRSLFEIASRGMSYGEFEPQAELEDGVFGDHLRRMLVLLAEDQPLCEALRVVLAGGECPDAESFYRLRSSGILSGESAAIARLRCPLYETFLGRHLQ